MVSYTYRSHSVEISLSEMFKGLEEFCDAYDIPDKYLFKIKFAVEETVTNILKYSYKDTNGVVVFKIKYDSSNVISLIIFDKGLPFDPVLHLEKRNPEEEDIYKIGGKGLLILSKTWEKFIYKNHRGHNVLFLQSHIA